MKQGRCPNLADRPTFPYSVGTFVQMFSCAGPEGGTGGPDLPWKISKYRVP